MSESYWGEGENKYRTQCKDVIKSLDESLKDVFAETGMPASYLKLKEVRNEEEAKVALSFFAKEIKDTPAYMAAAEKEPIVLNWIVHEWVGISDAAAPKYKSSEDAFITSLKEIAKDEEIFQKLTPYSKTIIGDILKEHEEKASDKWREMLSQKIDGVIRDMQEKINPESLGLESQERYGWFIDVTSQEAHTLSRGKAIDDLLERARDLGLQMPKIRIEEMNTALNEGTVSVKVMQELIDRTVEKHNQKGLAFWENRDRRENQPLLKYMDKNDKTHAFIVERTNKTTHDNFYAALIVENGKQVQLGTNKNLEGLQNRVRAYYVGITMKEIKQAINKGIENNRDIREDIINEIKIYEKGNPKMVHMKISEIEELPQAYIDKISAMYQSLGGRVSPGQIHTSVEEITEGNMVAVNKIAEHVKENAGKIKDYDTFDRHALIADMNRKDEEKKKSTSKEKDIGMDL